MVGGMGAVFPSEGESDGYKTGLVVGGAIVGQGRTDGVV